MMDPEILKTTIEKLVKPPKGILAIDESMPTCQARFEKLGVPFTEEKRREYRELLITASEIEKYISGYILFDETIRQSTKDGRKFVSVMEQKGLEVGIKVDQGPVDFAGHPGEKITEGMDGLEKRLEEYGMLGAVFAKWRAIYFIGDNMPSEECMKKNAEDFARYAKLCQEKNIVPIVEPEIMMDGAHTIDKCYEVTARNLDVVFSGLKAQGVSISGMILKTNMILPGKDAAPADPQKVAEVTIKCLKEHVPQGIGGIVFLSGGQSDIDAVKNLNAMKKIKDLPWPLTFSYGRAIQNEALKSWAKNPGDVLGAQKLLVKAARDSSLASAGQFE